MALTTTQALAAQSVQIRGKVEMQKDDGTWLDLSDRVNQDRLVTWAGLRAAPRPERGKTSTISASPCRRTGRRRLRPRTQCCIHWGRSPAHFFRLA